MADDVQERRGSALPWIGVGALIAGAAASWFWYRRQEGPIDDRTRQRLQPRTGSATRSGAQANRQPGARPNQATPSVQPGHATPSAADIRIGG